MHLEVLSSRHEHLPGAAGRSTFTPLIARCEVSSESCPSIGEHCFLAKAMSRNRGAKRNFAYGKSKSSKPDRIAVHRARPYLWQINMLATKQTSQGGWPKNDRRLCVESVMWLQVTGAKIIHSGCIPKKICGHNKTQDCAVSFVF